jgi:DNA polymerase-1
MKVLVLDIETNLAHDNIWCCVANDDVYTNANGLQELIDSHDIIVGHNIIGFDGPVLSRVWGVQIPLSKVRDTLVMSRLWNPQLEGGHSLRAWGERLGDYKDKFTDFDGGLTQEMISYCKQDVHVTSLLYARLIRELQNYGVSVNLEHRIAWIMKKQEDNGFKLNEKEAISLLASLKDRMSAISDQMQDVFPPIVEERYSEKTGKRLKDRVTVFNVGSRKQIAERLQELWACSLLRTTEKGSIIVVDEGTLKAIDKPEAQLIAEYLMLQKRVGLLDSWIDNVKDDGRVHGRVITNGAVTGRMTHQRPNMGQIPSVNSEYGADCRKLWTVDEGNVLVGTDLSGIELRCLAHYMQDDDWTEELLNGDIHQKNADAAGITRPQAKTLIYATLYGAGASKIGSIVGGSAKDGQEVSCRGFMLTPLRYQDLWRKLRNWRQKDTCPVWMVEEYLCALNMPHLILYCKDAGLSLLNNGAWRHTKHLRNNEYLLQQVAFVHDEIQIETKRPVCGNKLRQSWLTPQEQRGLL